MFKTIKYSVCAISFLLTTSALADVTIPMNLTAEQGLGKSIGNIIAQQTPKGVLLTPHLHSLSPGAHGFLIHQNPSCLANGMAAGDHLDPQHTNHHLGPYEKGHLSDRPFLQADKNGNVTAPILAPRLRLEDLKNHSLVIHKGGDNYSDSPQPLGGGDGRIACGVIN